jgi:hypothetical protein
MKGAGTQFLKAGVELRGDHRSGKFDDLSTDRQECVSSKWLSSAPPHAMICLCAG